MKIHANEIIDWKKEITALSKSSVVSEETLNRLEDLMADWDTCPCGQLPAIIKRNAEMDSEPVDEVLNTLGHHISNEFQNGNYIECLNVLELIRIRGKYLAEVYVKKTLEEIKDLEKSCQDTIQSYQNQIRALKDLLE